MSVNERGTILYVEDNPDNRNLIRRVLNAEGYAVVEAAQANQAFSKLESEKIDLILMDINMPDMDGFETTDWLKRHYPKVQVIALSMYDDEKSIIRMLKCGAKGYILKDSDPEELRAAIDSVISKGFHYSDLVSGKLVYAITHLDEDNGLKTLISLNDREIEFLKNTCTELTYKEIAERMCVSPRTVDGYRDILFEKLNVKTRVGLVMYSIKNGIVEF